MRTLAWESHEITVEIATGRSGPRNDKIGTFLPARGTGQHRVVGSDAHIAPVIAWGNDAASAKRPEASGDASLQLPVTGAGEKPPLTPRRGFRGGGPPQGGGGVLLK